MNDGGGGGGGGGGGDLLEIDDNIVANSVVHIHSQPVLETLLLTELHLNEEERWRVHLKTQWLTMF